ncbi:MAG: hypothetical protein QF473_04655 [Planctomycetota bacterium]|nr:hypothetical protein [Planctomycetota bacterium]
MTRRRRIAFAFSRVFLVLLTCSAMAEPPSAETRAGMDELWRRGNCVLSSIVVPAQKASRLPKDIAGAKVMDGRLISRRNTFSSFARDGKTVWLATDTRIDGVDLATRKRVASFTLADGLPDSPVDELVIDGKNLWIICRNGLGMLDTSTGRFTEAPMPTFRKAKLVAAPRAVYVVAETGTFALEPGKAQWQKLPTLPSAKAIARRLDQGIWQTRWRSATSSMIQDAVAVGDKLWVLSMGRLSSLDCRDLRSGATWKRAAGDAWELEADGDDLWALTSKGVDCHRGDGSVEHYTADHGLAEGRHQFLVNSPGQVWVATEPVQDAEKSRYRGGGISVFDKKARTWKNFTEINGQPATKITWLGSFDGQVCAASLVIKNLVTRSAHPGMMHVKRLVPQVTGLAMHVRHPKTDNWETVSLPMPQGESLYVLGQTGKMLVDQLVPKAVIGLAMSKTAMHCIFKMFPATYYGGHRHAIGVFARRPSPTEPWKAKFEDHSSGVGLMGEQEGVILVSESHGKRVIFAEAEPRALHVGLYAGRIWALSENALACESGEPGKWETVIETHSRFYWSASTAVPDGDTLWIGGDAGTISRLNKKTMECTAIGRLAGRKVDRLAIDTQGRLWVKSSPTKNVVPVRLKSVPVIESKGTAVYDGKAWREADGTEKFPRSRKTAKYQWSCQKKSNYLHRKARAAGEKKAYAFLRGTFKPGVLCQDGGILWLRVYEGILRIDIGGD